jgi:S-adenosylmethionine/arginine decarboxylase-like enzyme
MNNLTDILDNVAGELQSMGQPKLASDLDTVANALEKKAAVEKEFGHKGNYWGYQLILDCGGCDPKKMKDRDNVYKWVTQLVKDIDMKPIGEPRIEYTAEDIPDKAGFSVVQFIVTSDITAHFVDKLRQIYIDVFSCKHFDQEIVEKSIKKSFGAKTYRKYYITRQAD